MLLLLALYCGIFFAFKWYCSFRDYIVNLLQILL
uniref:Uncharacterized protein n=1 Tax=Anguilla anguilla TaxID=7936 RepID=A0A0E9UHC9_ANGAN